MILMLAVLITHAHYLKDYFPLLKYLFQPVPCFADFRNVSISAYKSLGAHRKIYFVLYLFCKYESAGYWRSGFHRLPYS
jgi:hypothetical protein